VAYHIHIASFIAIGAGIQKLITADTEHSTLTNPLSFVESKGRWNIFLLDIQSELVIL
jgi:hypothetical protein